MLNIPQDTLENRHCIPRLGATSAAIPSIIAKHTRKTENIMDKNTWTPRVLNLDSATNGNKLTCLNSIPKPNDL